MATHENWTWSHSILFFGLPFYHLGARIRWQPARGHTLRFGVYNGWNNALDNNAEKSLALEYKYQRASALSIGITYFTGVERPTEAREGRAWRHLLDLYLVTNQLRRLGWLVNLNGGLEPNDLGLSGWVAANAVVRVEILPWLFTAARGTVFYEVRAERDGVRADSIAIPSGRLGTASLTIEARPHGQIAFKLEVRYDSSDGPVFFMNSVMGAGTALSPFLPNATDQTTLTLGATAWF